MAHRFLYNDLVIEILLKLPLKSLLRLRAVCKSWCNIIDSTTFRKLHFQLPQNQSKNDDDDDTLFLQFIYGEKSFWELSIMFPDNGKSINSFPDFRKLFSCIKIRGIRIAGPINGLICIHGPSWDFPMALCNPSIGKIKLLPKSPICSSLGGPSVISREIGFGYDSVTQDYKVVQLLSCNTNRSRIYVEVYSRRTNSWKELACETLEQSVLIKKPIKTRWCNNSPFVHWRARRRTGRRPHKDILLSFDVHNEMFRIIQIPNMCRDLEGKYKVFAKDDSFVICLYSCDSGKGIKWLKIWELRIVGDQRRWSCVSILGPFGGVPRPMALSKTDEIVFSEKNNLFLYDICSRKERRCFEISDDVKWFKIFEYKGSLILP